MPTAPGTMNSPELSAMSGPPSRPPLPAPPAPATCPPPPQLSSSIGGDAAPSVAAQNQRPGQTCFMPDYPQPPPPVASAAANHENEQRDAHAGRRHQCCSQPPTDCDCPGGRGAGGEGLSACAVFCVGVGLAFLIGPFAYLLLVVWDRLPRSLRGSRSKSSFIWGVSAVVILYIGLLILLVVLIVVAGAAFAVASAPGTTTRVVRLTGRVLGPLSRVG